MWCACIRVHSSVYWRSRFIVCAPIEMGRLQFRLDPRQRSCTTMAHSLANFSIHRNDEWMELNESKAHSTLSNKNTHIKKERKRIRLNFSTEHIFRRKRKITHTFTFTVLWIHNNKSSSSSSLKLPFSAATAAAIMFGRFSVRRFHCSAVRFDCRAAATAAAVVASVAAAVASPLAAIPFLCDFRGF